MPAPRAEFDRTLTSMPHSPLAAITDEFSPDLETAARAMASLGMTGAELRMVSGKNIIDLTDQEVARAVAILRAFGLTIVSIASPVFKCVLPDAPEVDTRFQQDVFAAQHTMADQPRLARRAIEIAGRIAHVHAKDCRVTGHTPEWLELGTGSIDWNGQIAALRRDGYQGWFSLETHWRGPAGDRLEASRICGRNLVRMVG